MEYNIPVSQRIRDLVSGGVITIGVHIAKDGIEVWARASQPHPRLGVNTHESHTLEEIENLLAKVSTPRGKNVERTAVDASAKRESASVSSIGFKSIDDALGFCKAKKLHLTRVSNHGMVNVNFLPVTSITPCDLDRSTKELYARACSVAETLTPQKISSRIASNPGRLSINGVSNLVEWWAEATPLQRLTVLSDQKNFSSNGKVVRSMSSEWKAKLLALPAPFRGAEAQMGQPKGESSAREVDTYLEEDSEESGEGISW